MKKEKVLATMYLDEQEISLIPKKGKDGKKSGVVLYFWKKQNPVFNYKKVKIVEVGK